VVYFSEVEQFDNSCCQSSPLELIRDL
jgi:hypothetical protein